MESFEDEAALKKELSDIVKHKPIISASKVASITKIAHDNHNHYKLIAKHIIKFGLKAPTAYKLAALYLIDSITKIDKRKASDELLSAVSQYTSEFEKSIDSIVEVILTSGSDKDKESVKKLVSLWAKRTLFEGSTLQRLARSVFEVLGSAPDGVTLTSTPATPSTSSITNTFGGISSSAPIARPDSPTPPPLETSASTSAAAGFPQPQLNPTGFPQLNPIGFPQQPQPPQAGFQQPPPVDLSTQINWNALASLSSLLTNLTSSSAVSAVAGQPPPLQPIATNLTAPAAPTTQQPPTQQQQPQEQHGPLFDYDDDDDDDEARIARQRQKREEEEARRRNEAQRTTTASSITSTPTFTPTQHINTGGDDLYDAEAAFNIGRPAPPPSVVLPTQTPLQPQPHLPSAPVPIPPQHQHQHQHQHQSQLTNTNQGVSDATVTTDPNVPPGMKRVFSHSLFVGNLAPTVTEAMLIDVFAYYGQLINVSYVAEKHIAFVTYKERKEAETAAKVHGMILEGRELKVGWAKSFGVSEGQFNYETGESIVPITAVSKFRPSNRTSPGQHSKLLSPPGSNGLPSHVATPGSGSNFDKNEPYQVNLGRGLPNYGGGRGGGRGGDTFRAGGRGRSGGDSYRGGGSGRGRGGGGGNFGGHGPSDYHNPPSSNDYAIPTNAPYGGAPPQSAASSYNGSDDYSRAPDGRGYTHQQPPPTTNRSSSWDQPPHSSTGYQHGDSDFNDHQNFNYATNRNVKRKYDDYSSASPDNPKRPKLNDRSSGWDQTPTAGGGSSGWDRPTSPPPSTGSGWDRDKPPSSGASSSTGWDRR